MNPVTINPNWYSNTKVKLAIITANEEGDPSPANVLEILIRLIDTEVAE